MRTGRAFPSRPTNSHRIVAAGVGSVAWTPWGTTIKREIDPADWAGTVTAYLEVHGMTGVATYPLRARIYNETAAAAVGGSEATTIATSKTRARSGPFSFTASDNTYRVEFGGDAGATYTLYDAVVLVDVTA